LWAKALAIVDHSNLQTAVDGKHADPHMVAPAYFAALVSASCTILYSQLIPSWQLDVCKVGGHLDFGTLSEFLALDQQSGLRPRFASEDGRRSSRYAALQKKCPHRGD
jgi:hypothetical protein